MGHADAVGQRNRDKPHVDRQLRRIAEREAELHAWSYLADPESVRDAGGRRVKHPSPIDGLTVGVKDVIDVAGMPTGLGVSGYKGNWPEYDAALVDVLRRAGAIVLGKTATAELALVAPSPTRNPVDLERTPGGSSSGSAAAVRDGMVSVGIGTQTGGSIIRPASFCGVYGFKPSFGLIPTDGVWLNCPSLDTIGLFAQQLWEVEACLIALAGEHLVRRTRTSRVRFAFVRTDQWLRAAATTRTRITKLVQGVRRGLGDLPMVDLPPGYGALLRAHEMIMFAETALSWRRAVVRPALHQLNADTRSLIAAGEAVTVPDYLAALELRRKYLTEILGVFRRFDVLLTPSAIGEAPKGLTTTGDPRFCSVWTLLGLPSISVPCLRGPAGLPIGIQLVGAPGTDLDLLAAAAGLETLLRDARANASTPRTSIGDRMRRQKVAEHGLDPNILAELPEVRTRACL